MSETPMLGDDFLTAPDVARWLKVSAPTVYRWRLDDPTMPALVVGKTVRFPRARLERWLRAREQGRRGRA
jgi:excisionase family DNA binding protein